MTLTKTKKKGKKSNQTKQANKQAKQATLPLLGFSPSTSPKSHHGSDSASGPATQSLRLKSKGFKKNKTIKHDLALTPAAHPIRSSPDQISFLRPQPGRGVRGIARGRVIRFCALWGLAYHNVQSPLHAYHSQTNRHLDSRSSLGGENCCRQCSRGILTDCPPLQSGG
jgi:hypothetical protein